MKYKLIPEKKEDYAFALIESAPISLRKSIEVTRFLKGRKLEEAIDLMDNVMKKKVAVPFKKFASAPHKKGIGPGKYPVKAAYYFKALLKNVQANALNKGFSDDLVIFNISADKAPTMPRYGRKRGIRAKRTHLQVLVTESESKIPKKSEKKTAKPVKTAVKKEFAKPVKSNVKKEPAKIEAEKKETKLTKAPKKLDADNKSKKNEKPSEEVKE